MTPTVEERAFIDDLEQELKQGLWFKPDREILLRLITMIKGWIKDG